MKKDITTKFAGILEWLISRLPLFLLIYLCTIFAIIVTLLAIKATTDTNLLIIFVGFVFSWPGSIIFLGILLMVLFRSEISKKIEDLIETNWSFSGAGFKFTDQKSLEKYHPKSVEREDKTKTLEEEIQKFVDTLDPEFQKQFEDLKYRNQQYIESLYEKLWFEKCWSLIYRSQIEFLEFLNQDGISGSVGYEFVHFFDKHLKRRLGEYTVLLDPDNPKRKELMDVYLSWLKQSNLIKIEDDLIKVTDITKRFLDYLINEGYSKEFRTW